MLRDYPREMKLSDGTQVVIRPMVRADGPPVLEFFLNLPREDRLFLRDDVTDETLIQKWVDELNFERVIPILAWVEDKVVGIASLHRSRHYWTRHVAHLRIVTALEIRQKGLGTILSRELCEIAFGLKLNKLFIQIAESQIAARCVFKRLGFYQEAVLKGHITDPQGKQQDLILMAQDVAQCWDTLNDQIMDTFADRSGG